MCLIGILNFKEIDVGKGYFWLKVVIVYRCVDEEDKCEENWAIFRNAYLTYY